MEPSADRSAADFFGARVREYDSLIRRAVPRYVEMTRRLVDYLPARATRVLELGCGTGNLSLLLARRFARARLTVVDASAEMLQTTRERLARDGRARDAHARGLDLDVALTTVAARFEDYRPEPGAFDLVTSCISLHHVADKPELFRRVRAALVRGGTFRFADQMRGATTSNHDKNWTRWLEFCRRPAHCDPAEIQSLLDHAEAHDHYTSVVEHLDALRAAGFAAVDCVWRNWMWGIVTADR